jgi:hypothetical protein
MRASISAAFALAGLTLSAAIVQAAEPHRTGGHAVKAVLEGTAEVPRPGDTDGMGAFAARVDPASGRLCYSLKVRDITAATAAALYRAPDGKAGEEVLKLQAPADNSEATACTSIDPALAQSIVASPAEFYVNVRNAEFADGAIRGQLSDG